MKSQSLARAGVAVCLLLTAGFAPAAEKGPFREGRFEQGELKYISGLPVLVVQGTPVEIGRQRAALTGEATKPVSDYPLRMLRLFRLEDRWPKFVERARGLAAQFPAAYRDEQAAFAERSGIQPDLTLVADALMDLKGGALACSSMVVEPGKSATNKPLFGRNLDFFSLGVLEKYGLITVFRPKDKHAFASVGFPGLAGCLSGMNDAGLALAVHEVFLSADAAPRFNPKGVPCTLIFRRMLEECTTIEEAEKLLRATDRTTMFILVVCDRRGGAVLEATTKTVAIRRAVDGVTLSTNDFRTPELGLWPLCRRYTTLSEARSQGTLDVADIAKKLHAVNMGSRTVQSMIFEPGPLVLHLAMGAGPATKLPLTRLELALLFGVAGPQR
jgi:isopenicillin-N N-acyltransferase like protein